MGGGLWKTDRCSGGNLATPVPSLAMSSHVVIMSGNLKDPRTRIPAQNQLPQEAPHDPHPSTPTAGWARQALGSHSALCESRAMALCASGPPAGLQAPGDRESSLDPDVVHGVWSVS